MESAAALNDARGSRRRRIGPRGGVLVVLGALLLAECGLRVGGYRPRLASVPDGHFGWVLLPHQRAWQDGRVVHTNSEGFYDDEWGEGPVACAVLGSSSSVGPWVEEDARWPDLVEAELGEGAVMNCAVSGYGAEQMRRVYDRVVAPRQPRVLVVEVGDGAVLPTVTPADGASRFAPLLARSALYDAWCRYVTRDRGAEAAPAAEDEETRARRALRRSFAVDPDAPLEVGLWSAVERELEHLVERQERHGGRVVVLGAPLRGHRGGATRTRPIAWLSTRPLAARVTLVDPIERFRTAEGGLRRALFAEQDPLHWSAAGHREVAAAVLEVLGDEK